MDSGGIPADWKPSDNHPRYWVCTQGFEPIEVRRCAFKPTVAPRGCEWVEMAPVALTRKEALAAEIRGHIEAMRPLLDEWSAIP